MAERSALNEFLDTSLLFLLLLFFLFVAQALHSLGAFDALPVSQIRLPTLLIATLPIQSYPTQSQIMATLSDRAKDHGVTEDHDILHQIPVSRGQTIGIYYISKGTPLATMPAEHGIILETGSRVTPASIAAWRKRMSRTNASTKVLNTGEVLQLPFRYRPSKIGNFVMRWRVLRRLSRRASRINVRPRHIIQTYSPRTGNLLTTVPLSQNISGLSVPTVPR